MGTPRGVIDIQTATLRTTDDSNIFDIITPARIYSMICPSVDDCLDWINQINAVKSKVSLFFFQLETSLINFPFIYSSKRKKETFSQEEFSKTKLYHRNSLE